jgi:hypothetical protein
MPEQPEHTGSDNILHLLGSEAPSSQDEGQSKDGLNLHIASDEQSSPNGKHPSLNGKKAVDDTPTDETVKSEQFEINGQEENESYLTGWRLQTLLLG